MLDFFWTILTGLEDLNESISDKGMWTGVLSLESLCYKNEGWCFTDILFPFIGEKDWFFITFFSDLHDLNKSEGSTIF